MTKKLFGVAVIAIGFISGLLFFIAGLKLASSATELTELRSVAGGTVAEIYYQEMGRHGIAYSSISYACGLGIISLSLGFGGLLIFGGEVKNRDGSTPTYNFQGENLGPSAPKIQ